MSEGHEKGTLHAFKQALIPTVWLLPGAIALFPYATRPRSYPEDAGLVEFLQTGLGHLFELIPYFIEHPWLAAMALPTLVWMVSVVRWGPVVE